MGPGRGAWVRGEGEVGVGPFAAQGFRAPVTDGWPPRWVAVATRSVVRRICSVDSIANIRQYSGRRRDGWHARLEQRIQGEGSTELGVWEDANTDIFYPNAPNFVLLLKIHFIQCFVHIQMKNLEVFWEMGSSACGFLGSFANVCEWRRGRIGSDNKLLKMFFFVAALGTSVVTKRYMYHSTP